MNFVTLTLAAGVILALCLLGMAVGVIVKNKSFKSCGCSSITYNGEKIRCAGCPDKVDDEIVAREHGN